jgi:hypothetical protein
MWNTLGEIFAPVFAALLEAFLNYRHEEADDASREKLGQAETASAVNKESADAAGRMAKANAASHGRSDVLERLRAGTA